MLRLLASIRAFVGAVVAIGGVTLIGVGCASGQPVSFSSQEAGTWSSIEVREGIAYDRAWDQVFEILLKTFEIDVALKGDGYIRTGWCNGWSGEDAAIYRVRVSVKFSPERTKLQVLPEAQVLLGGAWRMGSDSRLVATVKGDLMGALARTSR